MKENKSGWQFPRRLKLSSARRKQGVYEGRPARRPFGNTVLFANIRRRHGGGRAEREVDYMAACKARRAGLLARFLYAFGYRIGGDAWRKNRRPRLR